MSEFQEHAELRIGRVIEVSGTSVRIELDNGVTELSRAFNGRIYPVGQLASIIKIHYGRKVLFAYVRMLRMRSEITAEAGGKLVAPGDDSRILEADLFAEGVWSEANRILNFTRGIETFPLPQQGAYLTTANEMESIFTSAERLMENETISPLLEIGEYVGANGAKCRANLDKLFGQHCAVLGSTGSGKSGTVAAILRSILEHTSLDGTGLKPRIILIDPHGEYAAAFPNESTVLRAYQASADDDADTNFQQLNMPFWLMTGDEIRGLIIGKTEAEATSQNNIVYKALKHARMVSAGIVEELSADGVLGDSEPVLCAGKTESDISGFDRDRPHKFDLDEFVKHIDEVQGRKQGTTAKASATERKSLDSILGKLAVLRTDPRLKFLMEKGDDESGLEQILKQLTGADGGSHNLKIVDISGAPNEVAGVLTAVVSRVLFSYKVWQTREERKRDPTILICEEAHRYVPDRGEAQYREAQDAIKRIAKEGRKYGLGLMLVSQRPSDVESTVLSQCNSWIVLRLSNGADQEQVGRFLPDSLAGITKILSSLSRREAVFVGEAAALPARIRIRPLAKNQLPNSHDISFVEGWMQDPFSEEDIRKVTKRWLNE